MSEAELNEERSRAVLLSRGRTEAIESGRDARYGERANGCGLAGRDASSVSVIRRGSGEGENRRGEDAADEEK
jgi:hypothetical protein